MQRYKVVMVEFKPIDVFCGNCIYFTVDLGFKVRIREKFKLKDIYVPSTNGDKREEAIKARNFLRNLLMEAKHNRIPVYIDVEYKREGDHLVVLYIGNSGKSVNEIMVEHGYATQLKSGT